ncbi:MAG: ferritin family protein [Elusimicrobiota bacterium]|nr:ferritin family protein [Elusimicrobiota bacterium]
MKKIGSLEFALDFEIKGTLLYLKLAKNTRNILSKQLFYSLGSQEIDHAKRVDEIYEMVKENKVWEVIGKRNLPSVEFALKDFFEKAKKINLKRDIKNLSGYKIAMEMEENGYSAYNNFYNNSKNESEKKFFKQLMEQEKEHLYSLKNVYYYLMNTGDWFREDESKIWSWMNI